MSEVSNTPSRPHDAKAQVVYVNSLMNPNPRYIWSRGPFSLAFVYHFREGFERYELRAIFRRKHKLGRQLVLGLSEWQAV